VTGDGKEKAGEGGKGKGKAARLRANAFTYFFEGCQNVMTEDVTNEKL